MPWVLNGVLDWLWDLFPNGLFGGQRPSCSPGRARVPDVVGETVAEARSLLSCEGFEAEVKRVGDDPAPVMGQFVGQQPAAGKSHRRSIPVVLTILHPPAG
jgi:beta-lactam-binding protein with PASTA domain